MSSLVIPTPFAEDGLLYINSGYVADAHRPVYAIRPGASGDITLGEGSTSNDYVVWSDPQLGSYNPSSLVYGDYYYTLLDRGILLCRDARTGREVYPRQRISAGSLFTASPWAYNGKIFALSDDGDTYVIKAGPGFEVLGAEFAQRDGAGDTRGRQRQPSSFGQHQSSIGLLAGRRDPS